jgi:prophage tail gpP-like protein
MSLSIRVADAEYTDFTSATCTLNIETVSGAFNFQATLSSDIVFPIKGNTPIQILADGVPVLTGYAEIIEPEYSINSHSIQIIGRDVTADFIDSTVGANKEFVGNVTLKELTRSVLDGLGMTSTRVIDRTEGVTPFNAGDIASADIGEKAFAFVEKYSQKKQVLLTRDGLGNVVLTRAATKVSNVKLIHRKGDGSNNNIKSARMRLDGSKRYSLYIVSPQVSPVGLDLEYSPEELASPGDGRTQDLSVRATRQLQIKSATSMDTAAAQERAEWEAGFRKAASELYTCVVQGHSVDGVPWTPNSLDFITDEFADLNAERLLKQVTFKYDIPTGSTTSLIYVPKESYTLFKPEEPKDSQDFWETIGLENPFTGG